MIQQPKTPYYPGERDKSFGDNGLVLPEGLPERSSLILGLTGAADGKLYMTGSTRDEQLFGLYFLARLNADGTYDDNFGKKGMVKDFFLEKEVGCQGESVILLADGRILVAGTEAGTRFALACYLADGTLNTNFGHKGKVVIEPQRLAENGTLTPPALLNQSINRGGAIPLPDAKILLCNPNARDQIPMMRILSDGRIDESFGDWGHVRVRHPDRNYTTYLVNIAYAQPDRYLACGMVVDSANRSHGFIARYRLDGKPDESFGDRGFVTVQIPQNTVIETVVPQHDGRIIGIGQAATTPESALLVRFDVFGNTDKTFNDGEPLLITLDQTLATILVSGTLDEDETIVVAGAVSQFNVTADIVVARFLSSGQLDPLFNRGDGFVRTRLVEGINAPNVMILHGTKIVVAGYVNRREPIVLRYHA